MAEPLPELIRLSDYGNDWDRYVDVLYDIYQKQIVNAELSFGGLAVNQRCMPFTKGKDATFWHLISEGKLEEERTPDIRRCERLSWIGWLIHQVGTNTDVLWYEQIRNNRIYVVLWCRPHQYVVILEKRVSYYLLVTAYSIDRHREKTLEKEWNDYWKQAKVAFRRP
jgi:hypothetical protein